MGDKKKTCFVVTPIGKPGSDIRRHIDGVLKIAIRPAFENEYQVEAAHTCFESTSITKQVYQKLYDSDLVIADLTGLNPNVMYELGIRFCFGKPVILIAEEGTPLPFDINERRTFFYKRDALGFSELQDSLVQIKKLLNINEIDSPIHDALQEGQLFNPKAISKQDNQIVEMLNLMMKKLDTVLERPSSYRNKRQNISHEFWHSSPETEQLDLNQYFSKEAYDELLEVYKQEQLEQKEKHSPTRAFLKSEKL